jgi:hypothetical protein
MMKRSEPRITLCPIIDENPGKGFHRSGWPYAMSCLNPLFDHSAEVTFDDFAEKTFFGVRQFHGPLIYRAPWIGTFHHPPDVPPWYRTEHLQDLRDNPYWLESLPNLVFVLTLGMNLTSWFEREWGVPCVTLKHPTEIPAVRWSADAFFRNSRRSLVQVGWYGRNTHAIYHVGTPSGLSKAWLRQGRVECQTNHEILSRMLPPHLCARPIRGAVKIIPRLRNSAYDDLLSKNIVFMELLFGVANNVVIECIARSTPLVINRHPGPEYYLGAKYPLFYDDIAEVPELLSPERILAAHAYLQNVDKGWMRGSHFRGELAAACRRHGVGSYGFAARARDRHDGAPRTRGRRVPPAASSDG